MVRLSLEQIAGEETEFERLRGRELKVREELALRHTACRPLESADLALAGTWTCYPVQETSLDLVFRAGRTAERWQISYWDAAIIEAARQLKCRQVLSEDIDSGQDFAGVTVVDLLWRVLSRQ